MMHHPQKRQRRQAAGLVVQSVFTMGKKSTAQPRPRVHVPPGGIGPIIEPNENDVLCGRGGRINAHEGNVRFREIVNVRKKAYLAETTKKLEKAHIAAGIVEYIRSREPPGRFLKEDASDGYWYDIGDAKAIKKAGQALREDAPDIRGDGDPDDASPKGQQDEGDSSPKTSPAASPEPRGKSNARVTPVSVSGRGNATHAPQRTQTSKAQTHVSDNWAMAGTIAEGAPAYHPYHMPVSGAMGHPSYAYNHAQPQPSPQQLNSNSSTSSTIRGVPAQVYQGVRSLTSNIGGALSQQAKERMKAPPPHSRHDGLPASQVAFGKNFTPTELSVSTISGMSGATSGFSAIDSSLGPSKIPAIDRTPVHHIEPGPSDEGLNLVSQSTASATTGERISQVSDLTYSLQSLGDSAVFDRSSTLLNAPWSIKEENCLSMSEESVNALMADQATMLSYATGNSSISHASIRKPPTRIRMPSNTSTMSWLSTGSQRSASVRSNRENDLGHDWSGSSAISMSELSAEMVALDLAESACANTMEW